MPEQSERRCTNCGTVIDPSAPPGAVCPTCGHRFDEQTIERGTGSRGSALGVLAIVFSVLALGLAAGLLWFVWQRGPASGTSFEGDPAVPLRVQGLETALKQLQEQVRSANESLTTDDDRTLHLMDSLDQMRQRLAETQQLIERLGSGGLGGGEPVWVEHAANPVFVRDGPAAYPSVIYDAKQFGEGPDGSFYKMWYDGCDDGVNNDFAKCGFGVAVSQDGVRWKDLGPVTRLRADPGDQVVHPCVLYSASGFGRGRPAYRMYYRDLGKFAAICGSESADGLKWQPIKDGPILPERGLTATYDGDLYGMSVSYDDGGTPADPRDDRFTGWADDEGRPALITSADGVQWLIPGVILFDGWTRDNELNMTTSEFSVIPAAGGAYHMFFSYGDSAFDGPAPAGEAIAYYCGRVLAQEALPLKKIKPIFHCRDGAAWRSRVTMAPCVLYDPDGFGGHGDRARWKMWFHGTSADGKSGIGYAMLRGELRP